MNMYYFSFTRFPSEKAHALYLAKVAESLHDAGDVNLTVVVPRRFLTSKESAKDFFNLKSEVALVKLPAIDLFLVPILKRIAIHIGMLTFVMSSVLYALVKIDSKKIIFSNDMLVAAALVCIGKKVIYEAHDYPAKTSSLAKFLFKRVHKIQTNNQQKISLLEIDFGVPIEKMYFVHNGVTIETFDISLSQTEARQQLGISIDDKVVVYTGHLYDWKGADILADAAKDLQDITCIFVGGNETDVKRMRNTYKDFPHMIFAGFKPYQEMPLYQRAADILVLPNTAKKDISRLHTSPMKVFEYMASRTLIVASDIPSIREVLHDESALFFEADNIDVLQLVLTQALNLDEVTYRQKTERAYTDATSYTWSTRATKVLANVT